MIDSNHVYLLRPRLSLISAVDLNRALRSKVFMSENLQVRAAHLILGYESLLSIFQDIGNAIIAGDWRRRRINVSKRDFLAPYDLPNNPSVIPYIRPTKPVPPPVQSEAETIREESMSSHLSLEEETDRFHTEEAEKPLEEYVVNISDKENESTEGSSVKGLIITRVDNSSEEEEEGMSKESGNSLRDLLGKRGQLATKKRATGSQTLAKLPPPPPSPPDLIIPAPDLKKKRK